MLLYAANASAQENIEYDYDEPMEKCGGSFEFKGEEIFPEVYPKFFNADELETINSALRQRRSGKGLMISAAPFVVGAGCSLVVLCAMGLVDTTNPDHLKSIIRTTFYIGLGLFSFGLTLISIGVPLFCVGNARLNWAADSYNQRNQMSFNVVSGRNGLGLALRF